MFCCDSGTIGFFACFWFVSRLYRGLNVDEIDGDEPDSNAEVKVEPAEAKVKLQEPKIYIEVDEGEANIYEVKVDPNVHSDVKVHQAKVYSQVAVDEPPTYSETQG